MSPDECIPCKSEHPQPPPRKQFGKEWAQRQPRSRASRWRQWNLGGEGREIATTTLPIVPLKPKCTLFLVVWCLYLLSDCCISHPLFFSSTNREPPEIRKGKDKCWEREIFHALLKCKIYAIGVKDVYKENGLPELICSVFLFSSCSQHLLSPR